MQLTANEIAVMKALFFNHYGEQGDGVWSWAVDHSSAPSGLAVDSIPGVVGSLCKKGLLKSEEYEPNENVIYTTDAGKAYMKEVAFTL